MTTARDINITTHGDKPIEFCGDQEGEIAVTSWIPSSPNFPHFPGFVTIAMALGTLAKSSDMADPRKGESLCYVAALPIASLDELIGRLLLARAEIPGLMPFVTSEEAADAVRLLRDVMGGSDRAVNEAVKRLPSLCHAFGVKEED